MGIRSGSMLERGKRHALLKADQAAPMTGKLARLGFAAKAAIYLLIGGLALQTAYGRGGKVTDSTGAMQTIKSHPFGATLLALMGISLAGYAVWRIFGAIRNRDRTGDAGKANIRRIGRFVSGVVHGTLAVTAIRLAVGGSRGGSEQDMTAKLLAEPFGRWLVGLIGAGVVGVGLYHIAKAFKASFLKKWDTGKLAAGKLKVAKLVSRIGLGLQGAVLGLVGYFLIRTAWSADPSQSKGIDGALQELASQPHGRVLFTLAAAGLFLYGAHLLLEAWMRRTGREA